MKTGIVWWRQRSISGGVLPRLNILWASSTGLRSSLYAHLLKAYCWWLQPWNLLIYSSDMVPILHYLLIGRTLRQYFRVISTPVRPNPPDTRRPTMISPVDANDSSSVWRQYARYYSRNAIVHRLVLRNYAVPRLPTTNTAILLLKTAYLYLLSPGTLQTLAHLHDETWILMSLSSLWLWLRLNAFIVQIFFICRQINLGGN